MTSLDQAAAGGAVPVSKRVMNLSHFLRQAARRHGPEIGFVRGDLTWTWTELDRRVDAMAAALAARGVKKGDRILVQSKNCNQMFESMFACFRLGAVWVPTNFRQTPAEVPISASERRHRDDLPLRLSRACCGHARGCSRYSARHFDRTFGIRRRL